MPSGLLILIVTFSYGHNKAGCLLSELEQCALIERVKRDQGRPAKIYAKKISADSTDSGEGTGNGRISPEASDSRRRKSHPIVRPF